MWRILAWLLVGASVAVAWWAQPGETADRHKAAEFRRLYESWQHTQNREEKIRLGEQAIAVEATLTRWPLRTARERLRGELLFGLGHAYEGLHQGNRADNLEKAIAHYEAALSVRTRQASPQEWAQTQNNLAIAYLERARGDRADNVEKAIAHHEAALTVRTSRDFPQDWARSQNNLANAYGERIRGERADNLEKAIGHFEAALTVRTREGLPQDWAYTQNNAATWRRRSRASRLPLR